MWLEKKLEKEYQIPKIGMKKSGELRPCKYILIHYYPPTNNNTQPSQCFFPRIYTYKSIIYSIWRI